MAYRGTTPPVEFPLFETIRLIDLFLSRSIDKRISYRDLQHIALACLTICSEIKDCKYFEFQQLLPSIMDAISDAFNLNSVKSWYDLIRREVFPKPNQVFMTLQVNCQLFYNTMARSLGINNEAYHFGCMLLELSLLDHFFLRFKQSVIGVACACLVVDFFMRGNAAAFMNELEDLFDKKEVRLCGRELAQLTFNDKMISLIQEKYQQESRFNVSRFVFQAPEEKVKVRSNSQE